LAPSELLKLTLPEATTWIKKAQEAEKERYKQFVGIAYMLAGWFRCDPKKFPKFEDIMKDIDKAVEPDKTQSAKDMFEVVKMLNARFGGN
jgi:hypothetical protein